MAVDINIHVVEPHIDDAALKCFFHSHMDHELEDLDYRCPEAPAVGMCRHKWAISKGDAVEVGSKHWLHPWWTGEASEEILDPITEVINAFDDFDTVTPELVEKIRACYELPSIKMFNMEGSEQYRHNVLAFLERNMTQRIFVVGW